MGNLVYSETKVPPTHICIKCDAPYKSSHGTYSERRSCREHDWQDDYCRYCNIKKGTTSNCFHYKK